MKRFFVIVTVFVLALSLMIVPAFAAGVSDLTIDIVGGVAESFVGLLPGTYRIFLNVDGNYIDLENDILEFSGVSADDELEFLFSFSDYSGMIAVNIGSDHTIVLVSDSDGIVNESDVGFIRFVAVVEDDPVGSDQPVTGGSSLSGSELFVQSIEACLVAVISWVSMLVSAFTSPQGTLNGLLPLFAVVVSVPALFLGIKAVRRFIWGA